MFHRAEPDEPGFGRDDLDAGLDQVVPGLDALGVALADHEDHDRGGGDALGVVVLPVVGDQALVDETGHVGLEREVHVRRRRGRPRRRGSGRRRRRRTSRTSTSLPASVSSKSAKTGSLAASRTEKPTTLTCLAAVAAVVAAARSSTRVRASSAAAADRGDRGLDRLVSCASLSLVSAAPETRRSSVISSRLLDLRRETRHCHVSDVSRSHVAVCHVDGATDERGEASGPRRGLSWDSVAAAYDVALDDSVRQSPAAPHGSTESKEWHEVTKQVKQLDRVIIRFAGDSGDGMQLTGDRFTQETAAFGNDLSTLPNFPAEIRAPAGHAARASRRSRCTSPTTTSSPPGDAPDVLVAMNPAALQGQPRRPAAGRRRSSSTPTTSPTAT